ncbi:MAG: EamA family transporter RarD [Rhodobacteraceae bacterium]|jgi:chloramphenicol-sensitive protein RarD|nr:EamA family transporter RarD [Paracoccaceae bacterium]
MTDRPAAPPGPVPGGDTLPGFLFALSAYLLWGFLPLYMKAVAHIPTVEVIAHRVLWSLPIAGVVLIVIGRTAELRAALRNPRMLAQGALTAALISVNWGIYVWAIGAGRALDTALGYYINPLFSVFLGAVLLGERLLPVQKAAIALAAAAVGLLTWETGSLPWVALALTLSWGFYAFFRKTLPIGPNQGFFLEVLILALPALGYVVWAAGRGDSHFLAGVPLDTALLLGCGVVTAVPLMLYANGAKLLRLSTIAMMQYIAPTMIFLVAVFLFREPFSATKLVAFALIWAALALFTTGMLRRGQEVRES